MASTIQIKRGTGSAVPSGLADGELAINLDSGQLYFGSGSTSVNSFRFTNLTADNYIVSSSVTNYTFQTLSGSSDFGDDVGDIHNRTGSLNVSGALNINGTTTFNEGNITNVGIIDVDTIRSDSDSNVTIQLDSSGYSFNIGENDKDFKYYDSNEDTLIHGDAGLSRVGIGDASPVSKLDVGGDLNVQSHITASGNISSSGFVIGNRLYADNNLVAYSPSSDKIRIGFDSGLQFLEYGKNATTSHFFYGAAITASGNISASGTIVGSNLTNVENTAISTFAGTSNITTVGTIGTGTWQGTAIADAYLSSNTAHLTGTQTFSGAKTFSANAILSGTTKLIASDMEAIHNDGSQLVISQDNRISKLRGTSFNVDTNITASGNISASGNIYGGVYFTNNQRSLYNIAGTLNVGDGVGSVTVPQLTASGDISSSGNLITTTLQFTGTDTSENATHYLEFKKPGNTVSNITNGVTINPSSDTLVLGGTTTIAGQAGTITGLTSLTSTNITASGDISSSGTVTANTLRLSSTTDASVSSTGHAFQAGLTNSTNVIIDNNEIMARNNGAVSNLHVNPDGGIITFNNSVSGDEVLIGNGHITASGNISASGTVYTNKIDFNPANVYDYIEHNSTFGITVKTNDNKITLLGNVTSSGAISASGDIMTSGTIQAGWHGSTTRIKILVSDFIPDDIGRPAMIDDTTSDRWLESHGTGKLFASIPIPTGFTATHVHIYGSATSAITVYEADINSKTVTSKGTGNIGTEINITDVASDTTNYLFLELAQASGEEVYGGYVTITPS